MAVIEKIRTKYGKLAGAIIAIALIGFILMDAASGRFGDLFGHSDSVVKVNGEKIGVKEYSQWMKEYETLVTLYGQNKNMDDAARAQMNQDGLRLLVFETIAGEQCDKLGITTTDKEANDLIYSSEASPLVQQFKLKDQPVFANPQTGMFDPQRVKAFEQQMTQIDPTGKLADQWQAVKDYVIKSNRINKFNAMFVSGVYTPKFVSDYIQKQQNDMAAIKFVKVPFTTINDNDVKVSDDDIRFYMRKHTALFTQDQPSRSIEYVSFDIRPSHDDTAKAMANLAQIKTDFASAKDNDAFVARYSDDNTPSVYANKRTLLSAYADTLMSQPVGTVYGPYYENGTYKLTKIIDKTSIPDSVVCTFVVLATKGQGKDIAPDSVVKKTADSLSNAVKGGADITAIAMHSSLDSETAQKNGGKYTFTAQQRTLLSTNFAKDFSDFLFTGHTGEQKVVKIDNDNFSGYVLVKIQDQKNVQPSVQLATITKGLEASDATINSTYAKANEFAGRNGSAQAFDAAIQKEGLNKKVSDNIKISDFIVPGIGPSREIVKWAYDAKIGDISPVFNPEGKYIIAKLTGIQDKGMQDITPANRPMLEAAAKADKKAQMIADKYKNVSSLQSVAQTSGQQVQQIDTISLGGNFVPGLGYEPKVLGYAFSSSLKQGAVSPAIKGNDAVYFISVTNRWTKTTPQAMNPMMGSPRMMLQMQTRNVVGQTLPDVLVKDANVKYNAANL